MMTTENHLPYALGGLLYTPALHPELLDKLQGGTPYLRSLCVCLEDSIRTEALGAAEKALQEALHNLREEAYGDRPLLFVRVRSPEHLAHLHERLSGLTDLLCGYVLPKFDMSNAEAYVRQITAINHGRERPLHIMPTLESRAVADIGTRAAQLLALRRCLDEVRGCVLNIRVGGNDFSQLYGVRRSAAQSIYDIGVLRDILVNIQNVFGADYVISGPVWEYFGEDRKAPWATGLRRELTLDRLNGFLGKTAIHPCQLPLIHESLQVTASDYEDARSILDWTPRLLGVAKSRDESRMNERSCHSKWAERILTLGQIYGIREDTHGRPKGAAALRELPS